MADGTTTRKGRFDRRFSKSEHLRYRADFARVFRHRATAADELFVVYVVPNELSWSRIGISVARRIGNAVLRNRVRRRLREIFRLNKSELPVGYDMVFIARPGAADARADFRSSLGKLTQAAVRRSLKHKPRTNVRTQPDSAGK